MATSAIALHIDAFFKSHFKSYFPASGLHHDLTLEAVFAA